MLGCGLRFPGACMLRAWLPYGDTYAFDPEPRKAILNSSIVPDARAPCTSISANWEVDVRSLPGCNRSPFRQPVLLIWGGRALPLELSSAAKLRQALPQAELEAISDAGHLPAEEVQRCLTVWCWIFFSAFPKLCHTKPT